jgi:hypothetical protein
MITQFVQKNHLNFIDQFKNSTLMHADQADHPPTGGDAPSERLHGYP